MLRKSEGTSDSQVSRCLERSLHLGNADPPKPLSLPLSAPLLVFVVLVSLGFGSLRVC